MKIKHRSKKDIALVLIIMIITLNLLSMLIISTMDKAIDSYNYNLHHENEIKVNKFSKLDYTPLLEDVRQGLGNITILNISYHQPGFTNSAEYPDLDDDLSSGALNITYESTKFIETVRIAGFDNFNLEESSRRITIRLNESLQVEYDNTTGNGVEGFLVYCPALGNNEIIEIYADNTLLDSNFSIENEFLKFNYFEYFEESPINEFDLNIVWDYNLSVDPWNMEQLDIEETIVDKISQNITAKYNYFFLLRGEEYANNPSINPALTLAENLTMNLKINLFDSDKLNNFSLLLNDELIEENEISNYTDINNNILIPLEENFRANASFFSLNFTTTFGIKFLSPVDNTWALDRLISLSNIRQRLYLPAVEFGPTHYFVQFTFYEPTILIEHFIKFDSQFERVNFIVEAIGNETDIEGIKIKTPSLLKGEVACPFLIDYVADYSLRIIITDNIKMPLWGVNVQLFYYNKHFGTYISSNYSQPLGTLIANDNGEIIVENIPKGEYEVKIYQNGILTTSQFLNTDKETYIIYTDVPHFPIVVILFGVLSLAFLLIGFLYYYRNNMVSSKS